MPAFLVVMVALWAIFLCSAAKAQPREPDFLTQRQAWFKAQIMCARTLAYTEASTEDDEGQRMVVWVAAQRALENRPYWGGGTICKVAYHQRRSPSGKVVSEFTGVHKALDVPEGHPALARAERNARAVLLHNWQPKPQLRAARFYQNPKLAHPSRARWFKTLLRLGAVGGHTYYQLRGPG